MAALSRRQCTALLVGLPAAGLARAASAPDGFGSNFADVRLVDQEGRAFSFDQQAGQVLLVNFIYTGCSSVCPLQTHLLAEAQASLPAAVRDGVRFVSVSLDPLSDTPATLKAYAQRMGADLRHWSFVTGTPPDIERVIQRLRILRPGKDPRDPADHASTLWLVDARGRLVQRLHGNPPDPRRLRDELTALRRL